MTSIHLRPMGEPDLPVLARLAVDPHIAGPFDWYGFRDPGARRRRLAEDGFLGHDPRKLAVALDHDDSCIGDVSWLAVPTGPTSTCWNIGIVIVPEFRGKGYGTAAQRLLTGYLFATTTANRVEAGTDVENLAEQRALERPGSSVRASGVDRCSETASGETWRYTAVSAMIPHQRPASDCPDAVLLHLRNTQAAHGDDPIGRAASRETRQAESAARKHRRDPPRPA